MDFPFTATAISLALSGGILGRRWLPIRPGRETAGGRPGKIVAVAAAVAGVFLLATSLRGVGLVAPALLAIAAAAAVLHGARLERWLRRRRAHWPVIVAGSLALTFALIGSTLTAKWHPIDDHDIAAWLGPKGAVALADIPSLVMRTEVGRPGGEFPRYRPSYFVLRALETSLWGSHITAWWASHLLIVVASIAMSWRFMARWMGLVGAGVLVLYLMTDPFWVGIVCRLGTAEVYGVLGTAMYVLGFANVARARAEDGRSMGSWILLTAGALIAMGSKENFLLMLLPLWALAALLLGRRRLGAAGVVGSLVVSAYGLFIAWAVSSSIGRTGQDVYQRGVSVRGRLAMLGDGLGLSLRPLAWWDVILAILLLAAALIAAGKLRPAVRPLVVGAVVVAGVSLLYAGQFAFYDGQWPARWPGAAVFLRYNFPGVPARVVMLAAVAYFGLALMRRVGLARRLVRAVGAGLVGGLVLLVVDAGFGLLRSQAALAVQTTRLWTANLDATVATLKTRPAQPVVVFNHSASDGEPVYSIPRFLAARGVTNPLVLRVEPYPVHLNLEIRIRQWLTDVSARGGIGYEPMDRLPSGGTVFGIGLSGDAPPTLGNRTVTDAGILWPIVERRRP